MKRAPLQRHAPLRATPTARRDRPVFTPASTAQRQKVAGQVSIVSGQSPCDPAHLCPRSHGGCDSPSCVVPLTRLEHRAFDQGELSLLEHLVGRGMAREMAHALEHYGDPVSLLERLTGDRVEWRSRRAA